MGKHYEGAAAGGGAGGSKVAEENKHQQEQMGQLLLDNSKKFDFFIELLSEKPINFEKVSLAIDYLGVPKDFDLHDMIVSLKSEGAGNEFLCNILYQMPSSKSSDLDLIRSSLEVVYDRDSAEFESHWNTVVKVSQLKDAFKEGNYECFAEFKDDSGALLEFSKFLKRDFLRIAAQTSSLPVDDVRRKIPRLTAFEACYELEKQCDVRLSIFDMKKEAIAALGSLLGKNSEKSTSTGR